jgi:hypothetical protein
MKSVKKKSEAKTVRGMLDEALAASERAWPGVSDDACFDLQGVFRSLRLPPSCRDGTCGFSGVHVHFGQAYGAVVLEQSATGVAIVTVWGEQKAVMPIPLKALGLAGPYSTRDAAVLIAELFRDEVMRSCLVDKGARPWPVTVSKVR